MPKTEFFIPNHPKSIDIKPNLHYQSLIHTIRSKTPKKNNPSTLIHPIPQIKSQTRNPQRTLNKEQETQSRIIPVIENEALNGR